jgi:hypothetical protein
MLTQARGRQVRTEQRIIRLAQHEKVLRPRRLAGHSLVRRFAPHSTRIPRRSIPRYYTSDHSHLPVVGPQEALAIVELVALPPNTYVMHRRKLQA